MKKKPQVVITGGAGRIAKIISEDLSNEFDFTLLDVVDNGNPNIKILDVYNDFEGLKRELEGKEAVFHLAWDSRENWRSDVEVLSNLKMAEYALEAAKQVESVKRVIMASSIHVNYFKDRGTPYGRTKVAIEQTGKIYANYGLEVICIRFGGIDPEDIVREEPGYRQIMLSRKDCANLIRQCLAVELSTNYHCFYGVSNNANGKFDWENQIGWVPQDDCSNLSLRLFGHSS